MNKDLALKIITGLVSLLLGVVAWELRTTIEDQRALQREFDLFKAESLARLNQIEGEQVDIWGKYNKNEEDEKQDIGKQGMLYVDIMGKVIVLESNQTWIMKKIDD